MKAIDFINLCTEAGNASSYAKNYRTAKTPDEMEVARLRCISTTEIVQAMVDKLFPEKGDNSDTTTTE